LDAFGYQVGRLESDTELTNHGDVGARAESLHESFGARLGDRSKVVDQVGLGHTDTGIADGKKLVLLVWSDTDVELLARVEDSGISQGRVPDFIESI
jgi:hypothetical protein